MAGRIRSIKPEILEDEKTAALTHLEWRLFVSLFLIADDYGNLRGEPAYVRGQILWATGETTEAVGHALGSLSRLSLLSRYTVRGQSYYHISGWDKHQKVEKPGKPRMPGPEQADAEQSQDVAVNSRGSREDFLESRESLSPDLRSPISDLRPEENLPPARAIPPSTEPVLDPSTLPERQALRKELLTELNEARQAVAAEIGVEHRPLLAQDPGERALAMLITASSGDHARVAADARHAIAVASAEAVRDRSLQWLTGVIFEERPYRRLVGMTVEEARRQRAGPRGNRPPEPPRSNLKPL